MRKEKVQRANLISVICISNNCGLAGPGQPHLESDSQWLREQCFKEATFLWFIYVLEVLKS